MGKGAEILSFFERLNFKVGDQSNETYNNYKVEDQSETERLWDGIAAILGPEIIEKYKTIKLFDGSDSRIEGIPLVDNFIPDRAFYGLLPDGTQTSNYVDIQSLYYEDDDDGTMTIPWALENTIPELSGDFPKIDSDKIGKPAEYKGYRFIVQDSDITEDSIIRYSFLSITPSDDNGIPDDYIHRNVGSSRIIYQKQGEMCIYVEYKSCVIMKYGIWTGDVNVDSEPTSYEFIDNI